MCGIAGWTAYRADVPDRAAVLDALVATMVRRGPDAGGCWLGVHAAIGHRRLAVLDLAGGVQPMTEATPAGPVVLSYSGEVYNHHALREELRRRGHRFGTRSDTEVVLRAYLEWGDELVERLEGMYAFAVWDGRAERLLLVRDRLGVKPLYWARVGDGVVFGSEPKAVLAHPGVSRRVTADGLRDAYGLVFSTGPSLWADVREVASGGLLAADRTGIAERAYWRLPDRLAGDDLDAARSRVAELVTAAAHDQLEADGPLCTLLSGGLDSSVLTALAAAETRRRHGPDARIRSFSVDYADQQERFTPDVLRVSADAPYARRAAEHVGTDHATVVLDPARLLDPDTRRAVVLARDSPIGVGDMDTSLYLLFTEIRRTSTVALSGEAADEVFGGYPWFTDPAAAAADTFPWLLVTGDRQAMPLHPDLAATLRLRDYQAEQYRQALTAVPQDGVPAGDRRVRELLHLSLTRWLRQLLHRKDRLSMATGLEVRVPYCDHRLVEYAFGLPWAAHRSDGREKSLLRAAGAGLLPEEITWRPKNHYPATHHPGYNAGLQRLAADALSEPGSRVPDLVDAAAMRPLLDREPERLGWGERLRLERVVDLGLWLECCRPDLDL